MSTQKDLKSSPILKGYLLKENWYGTKTFQYWILKKTGEISCFEDSVFYNGTLDFKGTYKI